MVTHLQAGHVRSDRLDDARSFVTRTHWEARQWYLALSEVIVGVAQTSGLHPDEDLLTLRRIELYLADIPLAWLLPE
jgi:hypothetical protein